MYFLLEGFAKFWVLHKGFYKRLLTGLLWRIKELTAS